MRVSFSESVLMMFAPNYQN